MAVTALLVWLQVWVVGCNGCLQCWDSGRLYFDYDIRLMLDRSVPRKDVDGLVRKLHHFFLDPVIMIKNRRINFVEKEQMEREGGCLFSGLDWAIRKHRKTPNSMLQVMEELRNNYTQRLVKVSALVYQQICQPPCEKDTYELASCQDCERVQAHCNDNRICHRKRQLRVLVPVTVSITTLIVFLIVAMGTTGGCLYLKRRAKRRKMDEDMMKHMALHRPTCWRDSREVRQH